MCDWSELVMSVARKSIAGLMQKLIAQCVSYVQKSHMHTRSYTQTRAWTCVSGNGAEARGDKMQSARQQSDREAASSLYT